MAQYYVEYGIPERNRAMYVEVPEGETPEAAIHAAVLAKVDIMFTQTPVVPPYVAPAIAETI